MNADERAARREDDDALVDRLGRTLGIVDPAPPWLKQAACELLGWRTIDADLADLLRAADASAAASAD
jgi:hypothetical protein